MPAAREFITGVRKRFRKKGSIMQSSLFADDSAIPSEVRAATPEASLIPLAAALPETLRMGTSSWHYPGWAGLVWDKLYSEEQLSRRGLSAYARHPLFRAVGLDRGFYRPLSVEQYADHAARVPDDFRFVVKAPSRVTDPLLRGSGGKGERINPDFLDAAAARAELVEPAGAGLGPKLGALVFQISPLPSHWLTEMERLTEGLHALLRSTMALKARYPEAVVAVEVRDRQWLTPAFVDALKDTGATYCLGLHGKMPPIAEQLPILRALWPGPLVCRWNLNLKHGAYGYERARDQYSPFDKLVDPDPETREALAQVIAGTVGAGQPAYVTLSNKAEGCSPLSVAALAEAVRARVGPA
ncbi:hypothetical protein A6D6_02371 [Alcanivorax xiamenensis]|uniref:DUF72 domain-containing protein n=2 Tax=Oceanospirillales TaxID=135619 RepID=A0ABQ6Y824_9GAMM|nr:hypothetical protein A6D6_02371 [Alcanivorax xiamenensis]SOC02748.1 uncharacterized protein YecE [Alloalcanivorax xenomutans]